MSEPSAREDAPFEWTCQRSGRCCTHGEGYVWLAAGEAERLAARRGVDLAVFLAEHTVLVGERRSLRSDNGRCVLLEGRNECSVYDERPQQCASFPYWPEVLAGGSAYERAVTTCPGMRERVSPEARQRAFAALEALYAEVALEIAAREPICEMRGICCDFEKSDHVLYATRLENDYAVEVGLREDVELSEQAERAPAERSLCPFWIAGRCANREGRPLGCRVYFCDPRYEGEPIYERFHRELAEIHRSSGYPYSYGRFVNELPPGARLSRIQSDPPPKEGTNAPTP